MLRLIRDGERPRAPDCGSGRARRSPPRRPRRAHTSPRVPAGARHIYSAVASFLDRHLRRAPITRAGAGSRVQNQAARPPSFAPQLLTPASDSSIPPLLERVFQERVARVSCLLEQALRISVAFLLRLPFSLLDLVLLALDRLLWVLPVSHWPPQTL